MKNPKEVQILIERALENEHAQDIIIENKDELYGAKVLCRSLFKISNAFDTMARTFVGGHYKYMLPSERALINPYKQVELFYKCREYYLDEYLIYHYAIEEYKDYIYSGLSQYLWHLMGNSRQDR